MVMNEIHSDHPISPPILQRSSSIKLRKRCGQVKQQFVKNRRSGEFGYRLCSDGVVHNDDVLTNYKDDTLDHGPAAGGIQHNLRPLLRNKYKIKHFGMIDQPLQEKDNSSKVHKR